MFLYKIMSASFKTKV